MAIKVVAVDIYGTVLASDDYGNELPPRKGFEGLLDKCDSRGIKVVTASDSDLLNLKIDLKESRVDITRFDSFHHLWQHPKNFEGILEDYHLIPEELFVIGDSMKDMEWPRLHGAGNYMVPEYRGRRDDFRLDEIEF